MENTETRKSIVRPPIFIVFAATAVSFLVFLFYTSAPDEKLEAEKIITIEKGQTLSRVAQTLKEGGVIRYKLPFEVMVIVMAGERGVISGEYLFKNPQNAFTIAKRLTRGDYGFDTVKITLPEGIAVAQMGKIISRAITGFDEKEFVNAASKDEGYLFPDTYFFAVNAKPTEIIASLKENFGKKLSAFGGRIVAFGKTEKEIIIMASIIEKEAADPKDRRIVSGILWKRIKLGMPLQVDATFLYTLGKRSDELSETDLKTDTPYNTYTRRGLPAGPIGNPGLDSITAALEPESSPYLYYLSDKDGIMHYAKNFEEHKINKTKYLNN